MRLILICHVKCLNLSLICDIHHFQTGSVKKIVTSTTNKDAYDDMDFDTSTECKKPTHVVGWIDSNVSVLEFLCQVRLSRDTISASEENDPLQHNSGYTSDCTEQSGYCGTLHNSDKTKFDIPDFVITGLHACGDLTPTMMRVFVSCTTARGLVSVACCYHKLTSDYERSR